MTGRTAPDIFLSYSRQDLGIATKVANILVAAGHDVWWDQALKSGQAYDQVTETALRQARVVIVLWSQAAVASDWVRAEATVALQRGALMPVMIEACQRPVMFELRQSADLVGWKGSGKDPRLTAFLGDLRRRLDVPDRPELGREAAPLPISAPISPRSASPSRRLVIGGAAFGAAAIAGGGWWLARPGSAPATADTSIAVLPFANLSGDPGQAYFSDGLAEELRSALARIAGLTVAARASSEKMRDAEVSDAAARLGVAHLLVGSVRKGGGTIRVTTQLLDGETGQETWSQAYDRPEGDALAVQTSIAANVADVLSLSIGKAATMLGGTRNPAAADAYLRGMAIVANNDVERIREKLVLFDTSIAADPEFAAAHANRSIELTGLYGGYVRNDDAAAAKAAALRAIALAPDLPIAHFALASHYQSVLQLGAAAQAYEELLGLRGVGSRELGGAARFKAAMGQRRDALDLARKAVAIDPLNPQAWLRRVRVVLSARSGKDALDTLDYFDAAFPAEKVPGGYRGNALLLLGRPREALAAYAAEPISWIREYGQSVAYARLGDRAGFDRAFGMFQRRSVDVVAYQIASIYAAQGADDRAFALLDHAIAVRDPGLISLRTDPTFDALRKDARYIAIEKRLGFPPLGAVSAG